MSNPERIVPRIYTSKSPRVERLLNFVSQEIEQFKLGEISTLSSREELRRKFGFIQTSHVDGYLRKSGLGVERRELLFKEDELIVPSPEWAWMMGILAGGGHVKLGKKVKTSSSFEFVISDIKLREAIKSRGERLFNTASRLKTFPDLKRSPILRFYNAKLAKEVGDFAKDRWVDRITTRHQWILKNDRYIWSLLEGFFEMNGGLKRNWGEKQMHVRISARLPKVANFLAELLVRVGIHKPKIMMMNGKTHHIEIKDKGDIKVFAENIHSFISHKETSLSFYRNELLLDAKIIQSETEKNQRSVRKPYVPKRGEPRSPSDDEVISEFVRVCGEIDRIPHILELDKLFQEGKTRVSPRVYIYRFGNGSYTRAVENLERIIRERKEAGMVQNPDIDNTQETQIFP